MKRKISSELDFTSKNFNPEIAVKRRVPLPYPKAITYNNIGEWLSHTFGKKAQSTRNESKNEILVLKRNFKWYFNTIGKDIPRYFNEKNQYLKSIKRKRNQYGKAPKPVEIKEISAEMLEPMRSSKIIVKRSNGALMKYLYSCDSAVNSDNEVQIKSRENSADNKQIIDKNISKSNSVYSSENLSSLTTNSHKIESKFKSLEKLLQSCLSPVTSDAGATTGTSLKEFDQENIKGEVKKDSSKYFDRFDSKPKYKEFLPKRTQADRFLNNKICNIPDPNMLLETGFQKRAVLGEISQNKNNEGLKVSATSFKYDSNFKKDFPLKKTGKCNKVKTLYSLRKLLHYNSNLKRIPQRKPHIAGKIQSLDRSLLTSSSKCKPDYHPKHELKDSHCISDDRNFGKKSSNDKSLSSAIQIPENSKIEGTDAVKYSNMSKNTSTGIKSLCKLIENIAQHRDVNGTDEASRNGDLSIKSLSDKTKFSVYVGINIEGKIEIKRSDTCGVSNTYENSGVSGDPTCNIKSTSKVIESITENENVKKSDACENSETSLKPLTDEANFAVNMRKNLKSEVKRPNSTEKSDVFKDSNKSVKPSNCNLKSDFQGLKTISKNRNVKESEGCKKSELSVISLSYKVKSSNVKGDVENKKEVKSLNISKQSHNYENSKAHRKSPNDDSKSISRKDVKESEISKNIKMSLNTERDEIKLSVGKSIKRPYTYEKLNASQEVSSGKTKPVSTILKSISVNIKEVKTSEACKNTNINILKTPRKPSIRDTGDNSIVVKNPDNAEINRSNTCRNSSEKLSSNDIKSYTMTENKVNNEKKSDVCKNINMSEKPLSDKIKVTDIVEKNVKSNKENSNLSKNASSDKTESCINVLSSNPRKKPRVSGSYKKSKMHSTSDDIANISKKSISKMKESISENKDIKRDSDKNTSEGLKDESNPSVTVENKKEVKQMDAFSDSSVIKNASSDTTKRASAVFEGSPDAKVSDTSSSINVPEMWSKPSNVNSDVTTMIQNDKNINAVQVLNICDNTNQYKKNSSDNIEKLSIEVKDNAINKEIVKSPDTCKNLKPSDSTTSISVSMENNVENVNKKKSSNTHISSDSSKKSSSNKNSPGNSIIKSDEKTSCNRSELSSSSDSNCRERALLELARKIRNKSRVQASMQT